MAEETHEEIEVIDVTLSESEIDEMIAHLMELKEHKTNVQFPLASDLDLSVTFTNEEAEEHEEVHVENDKAMEEVKQQ
jgi:hypothetical protein